MDEKMQDVHYEYGGIGRVKLLVYGLIAGIVQLGLMFLGFLFTGGSTELNLIVLVYIILIATLGLIFGIYLIFQRSKNIGINPWISLALTCLPIVQALWTIVLYIAPEGFWEDKRLDKAGKIWLAIIITLILALSTLVFVALPPLAQALEEERNKISQTQALLTSGPSLPLNAEGPLEQSFGLNTKCPEYKITQENFDSILAALESQSTEKSKDVLTNIAKNQGSLNPLVIGMASNLMVQRGQNEKALFWFYAGELRTLSDLNLYRIREIPTAFLTEYLGGEFNGGRVTALTPTARSQIELFIEANPDLARAQLARALQWDKKTPKAYNRLWLGDKGALPKQEWQKEDQKTRTKFQQTEIASIGVGPIESVFKPR
jgi:hypothetical protein